MVCVLWPWRSRDDRGVEPRSALLPSPQLINKEAEVIGVSDHLASEFPSLMRYAQSGKLNFPESALRFVDLDAAQINAALHALENSTGHVRSIIVPPS
ncbi:MAG: hypothetical protein AVDCRST_MAG42-2177 [uncultured Chthoniobacterales bacterium]|uniref:Alcohol dehydrogenase n=1 Tax=uncultured Chthoniobacterales bacterium TaxID=1836801 RepID=A0A6J4IGY4_9BACT|nr:MAG: hypothetical protein AVDCRST_MAG42-2177 [uncultured Chthoniobacterales bacterium]